MTKTPYTEQIESVSQLLEEVKDSDLQKRGTKDFANGTAKAFVLPRHIEGNKKISAEQYEMESIISQNIELVGARAEDLQLSSNQFLRGEEAYKRLSKARELDSQMSMSKSALPDSKIKLNPAMYDDYLREIVETGGAPSIQELT